MLSVAMLVLAQASLPFGGVEGGARPTECGALDGGRATNVWERAKAPELRRYCDLLASGAAKLAGTAVMSDTLPRNIGEVLTIADEADRAIPGRAAPNVLRGRALAKLGRNEEALRALESAKAKDERALDDPVALLAWARALGESGHGKEALDAYRALLPRAAALVLADRGPAYLEAGMLAMGQGSAGLDEAIAVFRQARRESHDVVETVAVAALALALDRAGEKLEARATLRDRGPSEARAALLGGHLGGVLGAATMGEVDAMAGLVLEAEGGGSEARAREAWQRVLHGAGSNGPWAEHARQHLAVLGGRRR